jgi:hypothetical protein
VNAEGKVAEKPDNILRIETVYRRYNEKGDTFFSDENLKRITQRFWVDWKDLFFYRKVRAYKGARKSEVEKAHMIVNYGPEEYLKRTKQQFMDKDITTKQLRTIREFIRDYEQNSHKYKTMISYQENEYKSLLYKVFSYTKR